MSKTKIDFFKEYHPVVNFVYFVFILIFSMVSFNPIIISISFAGAVLYFVVVDGIKIFLKKFVAFLPVFVAAMLINPLFNHRGATILLYFKNGNPLTLESILFGICASGMLATAVMWFQCFNRVITSDKIVYLFGRVFPHGSLLISMTLGFVPRFTDELKKITQAQKCIGNDISSGSVTNKIRLASKTVSVLISKAIEGSMETSDSMQSRGYGLKGRTNYSIFVFGLKDVAAICVTAVLVLVTLLCFVCGKMKFEFYPVVVCADKDTAAKVGYAAFGLLALLPCVINIKEEILWQRYKSKI